MDPTAEGVTDLRNIILWGGFSDPSGAGSSGGEFLAYLHLSPEDQPKRAAVLSDAEWDGALSGWLPEGMHPSVDLLSCAMLGSTIYSADVRMRSGHFERLRRKGSAAQQLAKKAHTSARRRGQLCSEPPRAAVVRCVSEG
eukprot:1224878-Amphidinium_carterae.3